MFWDYFKKDAGKQAESDPVWKLERMILYGTDGQKLNREQLAKYLPQLNIPEDRRAFLELLVWNKPF